ncbi:MAG: hypothetical protein GXP62_10310 [Oligoflexia bacterium]|nr:hypothetical protein [Oligoflexia bacterium]
MPSLFLLALSTLACSNGKSGSDAYFGDWSCQYQPWDWYGDTVQAALAADPDGAFDFDPPSELLTNRQGTYGFETGDLSWTSSYTDGYYGVQGALDGYGTIYGNGDVDLLYKTTFEDVLGETTARRVRAERQGCTSTSKSWDIGVDDDIETVPSEDPFIWSTEIVADDRVEAHAEQTNSDGDWTYDRVFSSDLSTTTTFSTAAGDVSGETTFYSNGEGEATQTWLSSDYDYDYQISYYIDGSRSILNTSYDAGTTNQYSQCDYTLYYDGTGDGNCTYALDSGTISCDLSITETACTLDCGSDGTYDC